MKKLSKVLYAFLAIPLCFTMALSLSACKSKNNNNVDDNTYMTNAQIFKILSNAEAIVTDADPASQNNSEDIKSSSKDVVVTSNDSYLNTIFAKTEDFETSSSLTVGEVIAEHSVDLNIKTDSISAIAIATNLVKNNITDFFNNIAEYSFRDKPTYYPLNCTCRLKLSVCANSLVLEYNEIPSNYANLTPDEGCEVSSITQIVFDKDLNVTKINYLPLKLDCIIGGGDVSTVASFDTQTKVSTFIPTKSETVDYAPYKAIITQKINVLKTGSATKNETEKFYDIYLQAKSAQNDAQS